MSRLYLLIDPAHIETPYERRRQDSFKHIRVGMTDMEATEMQYLIRAGWGGLIYHKPLTPVIPANYPTWKTPAITIDKHQVILYVALLNNGDLKLVGAFAGTTASPIEAAKMDLAVAELHLTRLPVVVTTSQAAE
ncbi:hypothetical protein ONZ45_g5519 [Pleurotus djamor]|nr:hypothetical protein ONZ45_g5519 [Pleurotus djamor]